MSGKTRVCVVCGSQERHRGGFFASFPHDVDRCKTWLKVIGNEDLVYIPIEKLRRLRFVCGDHFNKQDFTKKGNRLKKSALPTLNLLAPLIDEQLADFPQHVASASTKDNYSSSNELQESESESAPQEKGSKAENINLRNDDSQDYHDDVEYPEEDLYDNADIYENIELNDDYGSHNVKPTIENKLSLDEIDNLFASYSVTFRKFPSKLQTMLKLDLAKLFARYEMKNTALQCSSDEQQQAKDDTSSTILLKETKKTVKRIKHNISQPQPYKTTNHPPEILTHSESMMPKSQVSNKDTEGAVNKTSIKKNKAIIKKRGRDTKDNDNLVLQTNDQYHKPMKVRKLEEDTVDADTLRSQGTSALKLSTDRSSKKFTTESDKISQSQESVS